MIHLEISTVKESPRSSTIKVGLDRQNPSRHGPNSRDLPLLDFPETVDGSLELEHAVAKRIKASSIPHQAYYRSSPQWSLKFADHVGLSRSYLPCILAFDDPAASDDEGCVVVPLQDPEMAWKSIVDAISSFVTHPDTQLFIRASERARKTDHELEIATKRLSSVDSRLSELQRAVSKHNAVPDKRKIHPALVPAQSLIGDIPPTPRGLLAWVSSLSDDNRSFLLDATSLARDDGGDVTPLLEMLSAPTETRVAHEYFQTVRRLRNHWLQVSNSEGNPHIRNMLRASYPQIRSGGSDARPKI